MPKRDKKKRGQKGQAAPPAETPPVPAKPRTVEVTKRFTKDLARVHKGVLGQDVVDALLREAVDALAVDKPLPEKNQDHALRGDWVDHRDCHLRPDLVLIYRKVGAEILQLVRLGSHSEFF
jgi:mRNA interferase YafQ